MKIEVNPILKTLKELYAKIEREYQDECSCNFLSRRATHLDGQLYGLQLAMETLEDANGDAVVDAIVDSCFEEEDTNEIGFNPYTGCIDEDL